MDMRRHRESSIGRTIEETQIKRPYRLTSVIAIRYNLIYNLFSFYQRNSYL